MQVLINFNQSNGSLAVSGTTFIAINGVRYARYSLSGLDLSGQPQMWGKVDDSGNPGIVSDGSEFLSNDLSLD
jgi:hypothetical protein